MAVTVEGSGTAGHTVGTESALDTVSGEGVFIFEIDLALMAAGDRVILRMKKAMLASGTLRTFAFADYAGVQPTHDVVKVSIPVVLDGVATAAQFTIEQTTGTTRAFPWRVLKL